MRVGELGYPEAKGCSRKGKERTLSFVSFCVAEGEISSKSEAPSSPDPGR